jgi:apolipoprotein N-acyltransferase
VSDFGNRENSSPIGVAFLIQAIFWVGIALAVQSALSIPYVTLSMVFIGLSELFFKYLCIRLAGSSVLPELTRNHRRVRGITGCGGWSHVVLVIGIRWGVVGAAVSTL